MCEIIQLPIENVNYRFLYFRAKDKTRPIYEVWASSQEDLKQLCKLLSKIKKPQGNGSYGEFCTSACFSKKFLPIPNKNKLQADNNYHIYIQI